MSRVYDELWSGVWGDLQSHGPVHRHLRRELVSVVAELAPKSVLDVGCGAGDNLAALGALGIPRIVGADVSDVALERVRARLPNLELHVLDVQEQTLDERFELVMCVQVIEHLLDDLSALAHLGEMSDRWVLVSTMKGRMRKSELSIGHVRNYSAIELRQKALHAGLEPVRIWGWGFPFYSPIYRTLAELLPGGAPMGPMGRSARVAAEALYQLYRLNVPGRGDVLNMLARPRRASRPG